MAQTKAFELHFIGELELGEQFHGVSQGEGLFVDYSVHAGPDWLAIAGSEGYVGLVGWPQCETLEMIPSRPEPPYMLHLPISVKHRSRAITLGGQSWGTIAFGLISAVVTRRGYF